MKKEELREAVNGLRTFGRTVIVKDAVKKVLDDGTRVLTKEAVAVFNQYFYTTYKYNSIWNCYKSLSQEKEDAMEECSDIMYQLSGEDGRVLSFNSFMFTYGFVVCNRLVRSDDVIEYVGVIAVVKITPNYIYIYTV